MVLFEIKNQNSVITKAEADELKNKIDSLSIEKAELKRDIIVLIKIKRLHFKI